MHTQPRHSSFSLVHPVITRLDHVFKIWRAHNSCKHALLWRGYKGDCQLQCTHLKRHPFDERKLPGCDREKSHWGVKVAAPLNWAYLLTWTVYQCLGENSDQSVFCAIFILQVLLLYYIVFKNKNKLQENVHPCIIICRHLHICPEQHRIS